MCFVVLGLVLDSWFVLGVRLLPLHALLPVPHHIGQDAAAALVPAELLQLMRCLLPAGHGAQVRLGFIDPVWFDATTHTIAQPWPRVAGLAVLFISHRRHMRSFGLLAASVTAVPPTPADDLSFSAHELFPNSCRSSEGGADMHACHNASCRVQAQWVWRCILACHRWRI